MGITQDVNVRGFVEMQKCILLAASSLALNRKWKEEKKKNATQAFCSVEGWRSFTLRPIWPHQRKEPACILPFRGVVRLRSRMEPCICNRFPLLPLFFIAAR